MFYECNLQKMMNVWHYHTDELGGSETMTSLQDKLLNAIFPGVPGGMAAAFQGVQATNVLITHAVCQQVFPVRYRHKTKTIAVNGTRTGTCTTQNVQWSIIKQAAEASRSGQGGLRIGGIAAADILDGLIIAALYGPMDTLVSKLAANISDGTTMCLYKPVIANKLPVAGTDPPKYKYSGWKLVTNWYKSAIVSTMNRRTKGKGI